MKEEAFSQLQVSVPSKWFWKCYWKVNTWWSFQTENTSVDSSSTNPENTVPMLKAEKQPWHVYWINFGFGVYETLPAALHVCTQCHLDSDAALDPPAVAGRWVTLLRQVSVNQVEDSEAPASISTRISFSIPRIESANLEVSGCGGELFGGLRREE